MTLISEYHVEKLLLLNKEIMQELYAFQYAMAANSIVVNSRYKNGMSRNSSTFDA